MKKTVPTANNPVPLTKTQSGRSRGKRPLEASTRSDATSVRLEVSSPTTLAIIDPPASPDGSSRRRVRFGYFKPEAREVFLVGSFNGWDPRMTPLHRDRLGDWSIEVELPTGEHRYRFVVDGEWCDDPAAQQTVQNPYGGFDAIMVVV